MIGFAAAAHGLAAVSLAARAHLLALEGVQAGEHRIYNLGNGAGFSVCAVIETARQVTGQPIPAEEVPRRAGDPPVLVASSEKIQRELGWVPPSPSWLR